MSRCFPFPPPGYMRNGARSEALIESIKLQRETEQAKKDRQKEKKEKKREKKQKKKEEKERKQREATTSHHATDATAQKFKLIDEIKETRADGKLQKGEDCENEQLERSDITEELDQPVTSREPCLSDSSQSSKRKRGASLPSCDHGTAIRIRLPLRKHREPEESKPGIQLGSSSGSVRIADSFTQNASGSDCQSQRVTNIETNQFPGNSVSNHCKALQNLVPLDTPPVTNKIIDDESRRMAALYNSLLQIPPLTYDGFDSLDQDWLFRSDLTGAKPVSKKLKTDSDALQCSKSLWPRAQYMPEVDIYALPYAVPF